MNWQSFKGRHRRRVLGAFDVEDGRSVIELSRRRGLNRRVAGRILTELESNEAIKSNEYENGPASSSASSG